MMQLLLSLICLTVTLLTELLLLSNTGTEECVVFYFDRISWRPSITKSAAIQGVAEEVEVHNTKTEEEKFLSLW